MEVARRVGKVEAVRSGEREHDIVFGRGSLELEIEFAAEALAQRQAPGAVDAAAIGRVDDELHAAGFVEEALEEDLLLRRQRAECGKCGVQIIGQLLRSGIAETDLALEP